MTNATSQSNEQNSTSAQSAFMYSSEQRVNLRLEAWKVLKRSNVAFHLNDQMKDTFEQATNILFELERDHVIKRVGKLLQLKESRYVDSIQWLVDMELIDIRNRDINAYPTSAGCAFLDRILEVHAQGIEPNIPSFDLDQIAEKAKNASRVLFAGMPVNSEEELDVKTQISCMLNMMSIAEPNEDVDLDSFIRITGFNVEKATAAFEDLVLKGWANHHTTQGVSVYTLNDAGHKFLSAVIDSLSDEQRAPENNKRELKP